MRTDIATFCRLVKCLDDTKRFCKDVCNRVTQPELRHLLTQMEQTYQAIAKKMCDRIFKAGGGVSRNGLPLWSWRMASSRWLARSSPDIELGYVRQARQHAGRLLQHFKRAAERTHDPDIHDRLERYRFEIETVHVKIAAFLSLMEAETKPSLGRKRPRGRTCAGFCKPRRTGGARTQSFAGMTQQGGSNP